ncbi:MULTISPECIES: GAF domain-containing protein [Streptomyces]|uniref:Sensor histidine kinase n=1 Tax=Streptomyces venezuelae (strain ATCC 10712 / CBS 650.69 / DSM 40230 / JCM 4526 / NBRC 13096 / PD 04745) TaxID=953739 RepID=F2R7C5_STRVP|nr:GAF domain-containing protein [Streptomyces venezuelae]APE19986.1 GAF domain-containing protein [Streptomyces venezuelae]QER97390.1 GAF domain-containing protein [Streptomyces venezuelae ATCC 10712]CCA53817.1 Sensor histidine kinase [Streptomyces venezuelae ATCC 10712]
MAQTIAPAVSPVPLPDPAMAELLQSVVDTARAIFGAEASSILLLETTADELVFEAVSGQGQEFLVGRRFPAGRGIAGWVAASGEPMVVDDLHQSTSFDRDVAESTGYVPNALMAAPLLHGDRVLGVLEVLDPSPQARSSLTELDLLSLFARQAAVALHVLTTHAPRRPPAPDGADDPSRSELLRLLSQARRLLEE